MWYTGYMKYIVYKYTSPKKKCYIGITFNEVARKQSHKQKEWDYEDTTPFSRAIKKYGFEAFEYEVLERFDNEEEMKEREIYWIKFYDSINSGYNLLEGGQWGSVPVHSERTVQDTIFLLKNRQDLTLQNIADMMGMSITLVSQIKNGTKRNEEKIKRRSYQNQVGEDNKAAKLTEKLVKEIKTKLTAGTKRSDIQKDYGISKTLVQQLATGQIWSHVESDYEYKKLEINGNAKLNAEIVRSIKIDQRDGMSLAETVKKYGISRSTVQQIRYGKTWKEVEI